VSLENDETTTSIRAQFTSMANLAGTLCGNLHPSDRNDNVVARRSPADALDGVSIRLPVLWYLKTCICFLY